MKIVMEEYLPRLLDEKLDEYLKVFGALSVEGPKWCGKTWTSSKHAQSAVYFDDEETKEKALLDLELVLRSTRIGG